MSLSFDPERQSGMLDVLTQAARSLDEILMRLDAEVRAVLSSWDGSAHAAYAHAQTEWLRSVESLTDALHSAAVAAGA